MAAATTMAWAQAAEVSAGYDLFTTDSAETDLLGITFQGQPLTPPIFAFGPPPDSASGPRAIGDTDTIVHRLETASVDTLPGSDEINIELVLLHLVSTDTFDVDGDGTDDGFLYVTLQKDRDPAGELRRNYDAAPVEEPVLPGLRSFGAMTIVFDTVDGGTFNASLVVYADLRIGAPDGPIVCGVSAGLPACADFDAGFDLVSNDSEWGREAPPDSIVIKGVNNELAGSKDTSKDFWATECIEHYGHPDPGGLPTAHGTCSPLCTREPVSPNNCKNGRDDDCNGTIDDCAEDLFGPQVTAPGDLTFECPHSNVSTGVTGYATATDNCFPPALPPDNIEYTDYRTDLCGQTFHVDRIWTAQDNCGNDASTPDLQQIDVVDTTAPEITCPEEWTILWTKDRSPDTLGYATGSDTCGGVDITWADTSIPGVCLSVEITRTWTATDDCENGTDCEQPIHVRGPKDSIEDLGEFLLSLQLPKGLENSLSKKLENAVSSVCGGNKNPGVNQLEAFINQVLAQSGKKIDPADAAALINAVQAIIDAINEGGVCPDGC